VPVCNLLEGRPGCLLADLVALAAAGRGAAAALVAAAGGRVGSRGLLSTAGLHGSGRVGACGWRWLLVLLRVLLIRALLQRELLRLA
jgi:hypothetical protein